jgi:hypothetical protein
MLVLSLDMLLVCLVGFGLGILLVLEEVVPVQHVLVQARLAIRVVQVGTALDLLGDGKVLHAFLFFADGTALLGADRLPRIQRFHGLVG